MQLVECVVVPNDSAFELGICGHVVVTNVSEAGQPGLDTEVEICGLEVGQSGLDIETERFEFEAEAVAIDHDTEVVESLDLGIVVGNSDFEVENEILVHDSEAVAQFVATSVPDTGVATVDLDTVVWTFALGIVELVVAAAAEPTVVAADTAVVIAPECSVAAAVASAPDTVG